MERYRTTIILVVVLIVLGGAAFFLQNKGPDSTSTATPTPSASILGLTSTDSLATVDVISGTQTVSLRQDISTTTWTIISPVQGDADNFAVNNVSDQLKTMQASDTITQSSDLATYGLDKPKMSVMLKTGGAAPRKTALLVGNQTPDVVNYYVKVEGKDPVYIVSNAAIEPMKSWFTTPPKAQPTSTPLLGTVLPPFTPTAPLIIGPGSAVTSTNTLTGTSPITSTAPGAANSTTPLPETPAPTATVK